MPTCLLPASIWLFRGRVPKAWALNHRTPAPDELMQHRAYDSLLCMRVVVRSVHGAVTASLRVSISVTRSLFWRISGDVILHVTCYMHLTAYTEQRCRSAGCYLACLLPCLLDC